MSDPVRPQSGSGERKIIRIKKRAAAMSTEQDGERVRAGAGDSGEGGGGEEVTIEPGDVSEGSDDKPAVSSVMEKSAVTEESAAGVSKRRKLSRTPLSVVQATPTLATPTMTSSQTTTASQMEQNETRHEPTELTAAAAAGDGGDGGAEPNCEVGSGVNSRTDIETESVVRGDGVTGDAGDEVQQEGRGQERRKISISEMKAEM